MAQKKSEEKGEEKKVKKTNKNSHYPMNLYQKDSELDIQTNYHQITNKAEKINQSRQYADECIFFIKIFCYWEHVGRADHQHQEKEERPTWSLCKRSRAQKVQGLCYQHYFRNRQ